MDWAQYKSHVGLNLLDAFFKVLMNFTGYKPGDQLRDTNGAYLHESDRMRKILTQPLNQGRE
jgi:hypothetical protein